jgi:type IV pilus assembly protein PilO
LEVEALGLAASSFSIGSVTGAVLLGRLRRIRRRGRLMYGAVVLGGLMVVLYGLAPNLGVLLAANLVAAFLVFRPVGGSAEELEQQLIALRREVRQRQATIQNLKALAAKVEKGRAEGDRFISQHFLARRTAYSALMAELGKSAQTAGIKPKEHSFNFEPIEGSDTLGMLIVTANYEGSYADLVQFVNALDRSGRLLIVESLTAAPQQSGQSLTVSLKVDTFVKEGPEGRS